MFNQLSGLPSSYVLVIAEKPKAAEKIAMALGKPVKYSIRGVPVWALHRKGEYYVIASAVGHMYSLYTDGKGYPVYSYRWVPRYLVEEDARHAKAFLEVLASLAKNAKMYINACDYDIEGSVIGYLIIKFHGDERKAFRAKFSSLVQQEIAKAFDNLTRLDYEMIEAGLCRHVLDWLWGINISRVLMDIYARAFNARRILSAGRVQTPTLAYAVDAILKRRLFVPKPMAYPVVRVRVGNEVYRVEYADEPFTSLADSRNYVESVKRDPKAYVESISVSTLVYDPPHPFNLPDLQSEAYRVLGLSPYKTQKLAEDLYLEALISYPRTNSQKLPAGLDNHSIMSRLATIHPYTSLVKRLLAETKGVLRPNNGPKDDPAHPAIYPTGEGPTETLSRDHLRLYDLIVRRYIATFAPPMKAQRIEVALNIHGKRFALRGVKILDTGWTKYYPYVRIEERSLQIHQLKRGMHIPVESVRIVVRYTQPSGQLSRLSLLKWMEESEIGTEATRAEIIETLFRRGYAYHRSKYIDVSDLAVAFIYVLKNYVSDLVSVELTREFERMLKDIIERKTSCKAVEERAKATISKYIESIRNSMNIIIKDIYKYVEVEQGNHPRCRICKRAVHKDHLCVFHYEALSKVKEGYGYWAKFGYSWGEYLEKLSKLKTSGSYIKEVCRYLLRSGGYPELGHAGDLNGHTH